MKQEYIELEHVVKDINDIRILDDITLKWDAQKIHGIVGRNGSGKTMLLKAICGLTAITSGKICVFGKQIGMEQDFIDDAGIIIETPDFLSNYSGYQNLMFLSKIQRKVGKEEILNTLDMVGLGKEGRKKVGNYSLGMKQRLGLAQALMENPSLLLLDEPMNGLDNEGVMQMRALFLKLKKEGKTILLSSHNKEDLDFLCDDMIRLDHGKLT